MTCNPHIQALSIQLTALRTLAGDRPTATLEQALAALEYIALEASSRGGDPRPIMQSADEIVRAVADKNKIPPFD